MYEELRQILIDKYTADELVSLLLLHTEDIIDSLEDIIMVEFCEDGLLSQEWSDYGNS